MNGENEELEHEKPTKHEKLLKIVKSGRNKHDLATIRHITSLIVKGLMALAIVTLAISNLYFGMKQRIVMQPPFKIDRPIALDFEEEIDRPTVERMGELITNVYKNVTPKNVINQHQKLLSLVPSVEYDKVKDQLFIDEQSVIRNNLVRTLFIDNINTDKKGEVSVTGIERLTVEGKEISNTPMVVTWYYNFTQVEGFVILGYKEEQKK